MSAFYKVWMQVERIDHENDEYETFTDREEDVAVFHTEREAFDFINTVAEEAHRSGLSGAVPRAPYIPVLPTIEHF